MRVQNQQGRAPPADPERDNPQGRNTNGQGAQDLAFVSGSDSFNETLWRADPMYGVLLETSPENMPRADSRHQTAAPYNFPLGASHTLEDPDVMSRSALPGVDTLSANHPLRFVMSPGHSRYYRIAEPQYARSPVRMDVHVRLLSGA